MIHKGTGLLYSAVMAIKQGITAEYNLGRIRQNAYSNMASVRNFA